MKLNGSNLEKTSNFSWCFAVSVSVVIALITSLLDALGILVYEVAKASIFTMLLTPIAAKIIIITAFYWSLFLLCYPLIRILRLNLKAMTLAIGVFIFTAYRLHSIYTKLSFGSFPADLTGPVVLLWVIITAAIVTAGTYFLAKLLFKSSKSSIASAICMAIPFILLETLLALWLAKYMFEPLLQQRALLKAKLFSMPSLLANFGYLLCAIATLIIFIRMHNSRLPRRLFQILTSVIFIISTLLITGVGDKILYKIKTTSVHPLPHVILIVVDTLRQDVLSCYGNTSISTPNIDQLAQDGILFENAYAASPWTTPSISSIITGLSPAVHKATKYKSTLPETLPTIAEYMGNEKYATCAIGSNLMIRRRNFSRGFDWFDFFPKHKDASICGKILEKFMPKKFESNASTQLLTDLAIDWTNSHNNQDFFMWLHYFDPHEPYEPPDEFLTEHKTVPGVGKRFSDKVNIRAGFTLLSKEQRQAVKSLYDCEVLYVDKNVGRFIEHLKKINIYDNALIILTSDHGEEFWEHDNYEHGHSLYNELLRVPLIIKLPKASVKTRIAKPVSLESITPTILDLCQIEYNSAYLSSDSLRPTWTGNLRATNAKPVFGTGLLFYEEKESVIFDEMKYIHSLVSETEELYNLSQDPAEKDSLATSDKVAMQKGRNLLQEYNKVAKSLRMHYMVENKQAVLDKETMDQLKSLGYVK